MKEKRTRIFQHRKKTLEERKKERNKTGRKINE